MNDLIPRIEFPEIVLGLVSPIGTPLNETIQELKRHFSNSGYFVHEIRVTDSYKKMRSILPPKDPLVETPLSERYETYIKYGNQLRADTNDSSFLAALAIQTIIESRIVKQASEIPKFSKTVFIVHQFKRPEEIELLRSVYGKIFFQLSVYSKRSARVDYLSRRFAEDAKKGDHLPFRSHAEKLVDKDEHQSREEFGQRVTKIFHDADFIVNKDLENPSLPNQINRFCELLFSSNIFSPTKIEYGMFAAKSAALRSSDLSRQVGAAIFTKKG